ncbi:cysteine desulfurase NifS [Azospirillum sp. RWY-5-1]|uniref:Cysteine desulfurase n=1 Tax=Azospirillum oleiclasticum TaxID=2735135 RepID=A0ABX2TA18_9PROT|nr:cysteine desulfurase NifS [Azospirillum oleiclasticum]NYZ13221.1 cysteine desulfurase NifS [Azospirillum oleiclasticum]NYZ20107.1 cysteine desulfurase NifS [Azospirillum oleiclasticum]
MTGIYLDNNATTRVDPDVLAEMLPLFTEHFGNPSSMHGFGAAVGGKIEWARKQVQALLGAAHDSEIVFTSGGTESDNTAILSAIEAYPKKKEIVTSVVEHPAILALCDYLEKKRGYTIHRIPVDAKGDLDMDAYRKALSENVAIVSIMWANNETGTIFPIEELAALAKGVGAVFHTDAVQAVGKIPMKLADSAVDMLSLSGHKLHAPKGIGALYVKRGLRFRPMLRGGHQERSRRAGTENAPGIVGLGAAAQLALVHMTDENTRVKALRDKLETALLAAVPNCFVTGNPDHRLPNTCNIAFEYIEGEAILLLLNEAGIAASSGSACTSGSLEPSHVMRAMGVPYTAAHGATRFSLSRDTTEAEIDAVIKVVPGIIDRLRGLSPYWAKDAARPKEFAPVYS